MNLQELKEKLKTANLHPIHLEGSPLDRDMGGDAFIGNLEEYFEAVRVLGAPAVFILTETLEIERFQYEIEIDNDEESESDAEEIDLCKFNPMLEKYKEHIGQVGMFRLSIPVPEAHISFYINEDWWLEFIKLWSETTDRIDEDQEAAHAQQRAAQELEEKQILKSLGGLLRDEHFVRLPTQRSMIEYAKEKIPGLETVNAVTLKIEIQNLHAKIKAKGLGSKQRV
jgi:hypothetical protein